MAQSLGIVASGTRPSDLRTAQDGKGEPDDTGTAFAGKAAIA